MIHARSILGPLVVTAGVAGMAASALVGQERSKSPAQVAPANAFFAYLLGSPEPTLIAYSPTNHDPREGKTRKVPPASSIRADLEALRPAFDGIILYGYDKDTTPTILAQAKCQRYRAVMLAIWDPRSREEIEGTAALVKEYGSDLALAVIVGNEGINFNRYREEDVAEAAKKLRELLGPELRVPLATSEPLGQYGLAFLQEFGDLLAPNIHPVFDRPELGPEAAAAWARERALELARAVRKPVLLKETGFPHGGDKRFSPDAQKVFWESYLQKGRHTRVSRAPDVWVSYASAFESFDLEWKVAQSKIPFEGSWGLMSAERKPYPAFSLYKSLREGTPRKQ